MVFSEHALEKEWKTSKSHATVIPNLTKPIDFKGKVQHKSQTVHRKYTKSVKHKTAICLNVDHLGPPTHDSAINKQFALCSHFLYTFSILLDFVDIFLCKPLVFLGLEGLVHAMLMCFIVFPMHVRKTPPWGNGEKGSKTPVTSRRHFLTTGNGFDRSRITCPEGVGQNSFS